MSNPTRLTRTTEKSSWYYVERPDGSFTKICGKDNAADIQRAYDAAKDNGANIQPESTKVIALTKEIKELTAELNREVRRTEHAQDLFERATAAVADAQIKTFEEKRKAEKLQADYDALTAKYNKALEEIEQLSATVDQLKQATPAVTSNAYLYTIISAATHLTMSGDGDYLVDEDEDTHYTAEAVDGQIYLTVGEDHHGPISAQEAINIINQPAPEDYDEWVAKDLGEASSNTHDDELFQELGLTWSDEWDAAVDKADEPNVMLISEDDNKYTVVIGCAEHQDLSEYEAVTMIKNYL